MLKCISASCLALAVLVGIAFAQNGRSATRDLVKVEIGVAAKNVEAKVGDLVQFELTFPVVPPIVSDLKVEIDGMALKKIAVVNVPNLVDGRVVIGAMKIAAFASANQHGKATVRITPDTPNAETHVYEVNVAR